MTPQHLLDLLSEHLDSIEDAEALLAAVGEDIFNCDPDDVYTFNSYTEAFQNLYPGDIDAYKRVGAQNTIWKVLIDTGVHLTPPKGYYFELVTNSRLANTPFVYANSIGVIDPTYTGSIKVALNAEYCLLNENALPKPGDVVGQLILRKQLSTSFAQVSALTPTERGDEGFGSTANR